MNMKRILQILLLLLVCSVAWGQNGRVHTLTEDPAIQKKTLNYSVVDDAVINAITENRNYSVDLKYQKTIAEQFSTTAIYSVRQLNSDYEGPAFDVVNDQGTERTIYFLNGELDTVSLMLLAVNDTTDVYVKKWYDQGGSGVHVTRDTNSLGPRLVIDSTLQTVNGKPSVYFNAAEMLLIEVGSTFPTDTLSFSAVLRRECGFCNIATSGSYAGSNGVGFGLAGDFSLASQTGYTSGIGNYRASYTSLLSNVLTGVQFTMYADTGALYVNNSYIAPTTYSPGAYTGVGLNFGGRTLGSGPSPTFRGYLSEFVLFKGSMINNRNAVHYDANGYYSLDGQTQAAVISDGIEVTLPSLDTVKIGTQITISTTDNGRTSGVISSDSIYAKNTLYRRLPTYGNNAYTFQAVRDSRDSLVWKLVNSTDATYSNADTIGVVQLRSASDLATKRYKVGKVVKLSNGAEYEIVEGLITGSTLDNKGQVLLANNTYARMKGNSGTINYSWFRGITSNPDSNHLIGQAAMNYARIASGINEVLFDYDTATFKNTMYIPPHITARGLNKTGVDFDNNPQQITYADFQGDTTKFIFTTLQTGEYYPQGAGAADFYIEAVSQGGGGIFCDSGWGNHFENIAIEGTNNKYFHDGFAIGNSLHVRAENIYVADCIRDFSGNVPATNSGSIGGGSNVTFIRSGALGGDYGIYNAGRWTFLEVNLEAQDSMSIYSDTNSDISIYKVEGERNIQFFNIVRGRLFVSGGKYTPLGGTSSFFGTVDTGSVSIDGVNFGTFGVSSGITTANTTAFSLTNNTMSVENLISPEQIFNNMDVVTLRNNVNTSGASQNNGTNKPFSSVSKNKIGRSKSTESTLYNSDITGDGRLSLTIKKDTLNLVPHSAFYNELSDWEGSAGSGALTLGDTVIIDHLGDTTTAVYIAYATDIAGNVSFIDNILLSQPILAGEEYNVSYYAYRSGTGRANLFINGQNESTTTNFPPVVSSTPVRYELSKVADATSSSLTWRVGDGAEPNDTIFLYGVQVSRGPWSRTYQKMPTENSNNPFIKIPDGSLEIRGNTTITGTLTAEKYHPFTPIPYNAVDTIVVDTINTAFAITPDIDASDLKQVTYTTDAQVTGDLSIRLLYRDVSADTYTPIGSGTITTGNNQVTISGLTQTVTSGDFIYPEVTASDGGGPGTTPANGLHINLKFQ